MTTPTTELQTVPVHVTNAHEIRRQVPPEKPRDIEVNTKTFILKTSQTSDPVDSAVQRILDRDVSRTQAIINVATGTVYLCHSRAQAQAAAADSAGINLSSANAEGSVTNPGAFASIAATGTLPLGTYNVAATVYLSGTVTSADANNMQIALLGGNVANIKIAYPGVANVPVTYTAVLQVNGSGQQIGIQTPAAASGVSAVYNASVVATPVSGTLAGQAQDGFLVVAGQPLPPLTTTDPLWAAVPADKAGEGALVSVIAERRRS